MAGFDDSHTHRKPLKKAKNQRKGVKRAVRQAKKAEQSWPNTKLGNFVKRAHQSRLSNAASRPGIPGIGQSGKTNSFNRSAGNSSRSVSKIGPARAQPPSLFGPRANIKQRGFQRTARKFQGTGPRPYSPKR